MMEFDYTHDRAVLRTKARRIVGIPPEPEEYRCSWNDGFVTDSLTEAYVHAKVVHNDPPDQIAI